MKALRNLFTKNCMMIGAPIEGKLVSINEVSDPTFGEEIIGKGAAIIPSANQVYAPVNGKVATVFPTGHAIALVADDGEEILIHIGLDTVKLNGERSMFRRSRQLKRVTFSWRRILRRSRRQAMMS